MWLHALCTIVLIHLPFISSLHVELNEEWILQDFSLKNFNGTWFEAGQYNKLISGTSLCPVWVFSVKTGDGDNFAEADVIYRTHSHVLHKELTYTGTIKLLPLFRNKPGRFVYDIDLYPSHNEDWLNSGEVHARFTVIDTDYDTFAFIYLIEREVTAYPKDSIIAISKYVEYAKSFKKYWMKSYLSRIVKLDYSKNMCTPPLPEDPHPPRKWVTEDGKSGTTSTKEVGATNMFKSLTPKVLNTDLEGEINPHFQHL